MEVYIQSCVHDTNSYASEFPFPRLSMHPPAQLGVRLIDVAIVLTIIPKSNYYQSLPARLVHTSRYPTGKGQAT